MLQWLKQSVADFFDWLTRWPTEFADWLRDTLLAWYLWAADLIRAIFTSASDFLSDAVCFVIVKGLDIVKAGMDAVDVSSLSGFADGVQLPPEIVNVMQLAGVGTAVTIIVTAIGIRLVLQLIPFTRLGS